MPPQQPHTPVSIFRLFIYASIAISLLTAFGIYGLSITILVSAQTTNSQQNEGAEKGKPQPPQPDAAPPSQNANKSHFIEYFPRMAIPLTASISILLVASGILFQFSEHKKKNKSEFISKSMMIKNSISMNMANLLPRHDKEEKERNNRTMAFNEIMIAFNDVIVDIGMTKGKLISSNTYCSKINLIDQTGVNQIKSSIAHMIDLVSCRLTAYFAESWILDGFIVPIQKNVQNNTLRRSASTNSSDHPSGASSDHPTSCVECHLERVMEKNDFCTDFEDAACRAAISMARILGGYFSFIIESISDKEIRESKLIPYHEVAPLMFYVMIKTKGGGLLSADQINNIRLFLQSYEDNFMSEKKGSSHSIVRAKYEIFYEFLECKENSAKY